MTYLNGDVVSYVSLLFECALIDGAPTLNDESTAVDWFAPDALPQPFTSNHIPRVQDAVARQVAAFYR
jgi:hypothetical protein